MINLVFPAADFYERADAAIADGEIFSIRVTEKAQVVSRAIYLYHEYYFRKSQGKKDYRMLWTLGWHMWQAPELWAILNRADINGCKVTSQPDGAELLITIAS